MEKKVIVTACNILYGFNNPKADLAEKLYIYLKDNENIKERMIPSYTDLENIIEEDSSSIIDYEYDEINNIIFCEYAIFSQISTKGIDKKILNNKHMDINSIIEMNDEELASIKQITFFCIKGNTLVSSSISSNKKLVLKSLENYFSYVTRDTITIRLKSKIIKNLRLGNIQSIRIGNNSNGELEDNIKKTQNYNSGFGDIIRKRIIFVNDEQDIDLNEVFDSYYTLKINKKAKDPKVLENILTLFDDDNIIITTTDRKTIKGNVIVIRKEIKYSVDNSRLYNIKEIKAEMCNFIVEI